METPQIFKSIKSVAYFKALELLQAEDVIFYRDIFRDQPYRWLYDRIKPNTLVIDLGAAIGDTAIYFSMNPNVKEIWGYEPDYKRYARLEANLKHTNGNPTPTNFKRIVKTYNIAVDWYKLQEILMEAKKPVAIKCDIEGGEYALFSNGARNQIDLSKVYAIIMEYHNGYREIVKTLRAKGFKAVHKPVQGRTLKMKEVGYIYAEK